MRGNREVDEEGRRWASPDAKIFTSRGKCPNGHKLVPSDSLVLTRHQGGWRMYYCVAKKCKYSVGR